MSNEAWLLIRGVDSSLWSHRIRPDRQVLGRGPGCEIPIAHSTVSRQHAEIWSQNDRLYVRDRSSSNGTFVNGKQITESPTAIGDAIQLGRVILDVVSEIETSDLDSTLVGGTQRAALDAKPESQLSNGQERVVQLLLKGLSEKQVATTLRLSPHTIHTHVKRIYKALGVQSRGELMAKLMTKTQEVKIDR